MGVWISRGNFISLLYKACAVSLYTILVRKIGGHFVTLFFNMSQNDLKLPNRILLIFSAIHIKSFAFRFATPNGMALFIGPKLEYVWKHKTDEEFEGFGHSGIKEELRPINISSVIGLGVNIANIFFDFRYEIGLTNISKSIIYEKNIDGVIFQEKGIFINRHRNVLSFSLGVIF